jgi:solute carrier family 35 (UDP-galactose transporter), member B1
MNLYELLFAIVLCLVSGELLDGLAFISKHPAILSPLSYFLCCMGLGNVFIYALQKRSGALAVTTTTTLRKMVSVMFSVFWFGHNLHWLQWVAAAVAFTGKPLSQQLVGMGIHNYVKTI